MSGNQNTTPMLSIDQAVKILLAGGIVAIPTETVYGLAGNASNPESIKKIFKAKGRPENHPLIVHISSFDEIYLWAKVVPEKAKILAKKFWPGPLTMVLAKADSVNYSITGGQETVAIRVPNQKLTLEILKKMGTGVAAPSANRFGHVSPTMPSHVLEELDGLIDGVVDGGQCEVGIESTIVDLTSDTVRLLRPGRISIDELELCLGEKISINSVNAPRVPGLLKSHYAPNTPLKIIDYNQLDTEINNYIKKGFSINIWSQHKPKIENPLLFWIQAPKDPIQFAHDLYDQIRKFDKNHSDIILIEKPSIENNAWQGVLDRLTRAQAHFE